MKTLFISCFWIVAMFLSFRTQAQLTAPMNFPLPPNPAIGGISSAEYFIDTDPGFDNGTSIAVTSGNDVSVSNLAVPLSNLSSGVHRLYIRIKNTANKWSLTNEVNFFIYKVIVPPPNAAIDSILTAEYYIDTDPGFDNGTSIPVTSGNDVSVSNLAVPLSNLSSGVHRLYIRIKNAANKWSLTNEVNFFIYKVIVLPPNAAIDSILTAEYYIDTDPGFGSGTNIPVAQGTDVTVSNIAVPIDTFSIGAHRLYVRVKHADGKWSLSNVAVFFLTPVNFTIPPNASLGAITAFEYFFDSDPGFGNGTMVTVPPTTDLSNYTLAASISGLTPNSNHTLYIRALDGWSLTTRKEFTIGWPLNLSAISLTGRMLEDNTVMLNWQTINAKNALRFNIDRSIDGKNFNQIGSVAAASSGNTDLYQFRDLTPPAGDIFYRIRELDLDGKVIHSSVLPLKTSREVATNFYIVNNPANDVLKVYTGSSATDAQLEILDETGRKMLKAPVTTSGIEQLNISTLPAGSYLLVFKNHAEQICRRFIKQ